MGKRFTDTEIYDDPWYMDLTACQKLFWDYICRKCDNAGVWKINKPMAELCVGMRLDIDEMLSSLGDRIMVIPGGTKWWIKGFISFQYGELKESCKPHVKVIELLKKNNLLEIYKGYPKGIYTLKEKEEEEEEERKRIKRSSGDVFIVPTFDEFYAYCKEKGFSRIAQRAFDSYDAADWCDTRGNEIKVWKSKLCNSWFREDSSDKVTTFDTSDDEREQIRRELLGLGEG